MVEFSSNDKKIYDYIVSNSTVTQSELPNALHIGKASIRKFKEVHGDLIVGDQNITVIDFFERNKKEKKNNERKEFYSERFLKLVEFYEKNLDSTYTDIADAISESRKSVSEMFSLFFDYRLSNGRTLEEQFNYSNILREQLCNEIFEIFNNDPNLSFSDIEKKLNKDLPRGKVRKLLIEMGDRILSNGNTISTQLELKRLNKTDELLEKEKLVLELFSNDSSLTPTMLSKMTGIDRATVIWYLDKNKDYMLSNGLTIKEQRNYNKTLVEKNIQDKKNIVLNYFINNPYSSYNEISEATNIDKTSVSRYLNEYGDYIIPGLNVSVAFQIEMNQTRFRKLELDILEYFDSNPTAQFKDIAKEFNCSPTFISRTIHSYEEYMLSNGITVFEQLKINQNYVDEDIIVNEFINHPTYSLHKLAEVCNVDLDTVRSHLYRFVDIELENGLTIGEQLNKNNKEIWFRKDDIVPKEGVFLRDKDSKYLELVIDVDDTNIDLRDVNGKKIGTIEVSDEFEERIIKEAIKYVMTPNVSLKEFSKELGIHPSTLKRHLEKVKDINYKLYKVVDEKIKLTCKSRKTKSGIILDNYSKEEIISIGKFMMENRLNYENISRIYNIDALELEFLINKYCPQYKVVSDNIGVQNKSI